MGLQRLPSVLEGLLSVQNLLKYRHKQIKIFMVTVSILTRPVPMIVVVYHVAIVSMGMGC